MITYDLTAKRLTGLSRPELRYSNAPQRMTVRLTGTMPAASRWIASVALNSKTAAEVVLSRTTEGQVTVSGNDLVIDWKTDTTTWLAACAGQDNGVSATCVIRPLDASGEELDYIAFALLALPAVDPLGVIDQPSQVAAQTIITINGAVGNLTIKDSTGATLAVTNGVITIPAGVSVNGLSGAVRLVDADGNPFEADGQDIMINAGGAGDVTLAGDNAFLGENSFAEPITIAGNAVTGLIEDRSQITWPSVVDEKYDRCRYFDATFDVLNFVSMQVRVKQMRMVVVSANPTYTGNVVYVPYTASDKTFADQVAGDPIVVAVGATPAEVVFDLVVDKKFLRLVRDYSNVFDTLKDDTSTPITAIVPFYSVEVSNERPVA